MHVCFFPVLFIIFARKLEIIFKYFEDKNVKNAIFRNILSNIFKFV